MILDTSAIVAILCDEQPRYKLEVALASSLSACRVGTPTLVESSLVLTARCDSTGSLLLDRFLQWQRTDVVSFSEAHWRIAQQASMRYGKGRHPAALNFGDCFTYATAALAGEPLLCIGDDFARTDLELVEVPRN